MMFCILLLIQKSDLHNRDTSMGTNDAIYEEISYKTELLSSKIKQLEDKISNLQDIKMESPECCIKKVSDNVLQALDRSIKYEKIDLNLIKYTSDKERSGPNFVTEYIFRKIRKPNSFIKYVSKIFGVYQPIQPGVDNMWHFRGNQLNLTFSSTFNSRMHMIKISNSEEEGCLPKELYVEFVKGNSTLLFGPYDLPRNLKTPFKINLSHPVYFRYFTLIIKNNWGGDHVCLPHVTGYNTPYINHELEY